jgi:hypothetical protein
MELDKFLKLDTSECVQFVLTQSTLRRALQSLKNKKWTISCRPSNDVARCDHCSETDNKIKQSQHEGDDKAMLFWRDQKVKHLRQQSEQRIALSHIKSYCLRNRNRKWVIAQDGMDQAKTELPYVPPGELAKKLDSGSAFIRLKTHVVGVIGFGPPVSVMGIVNCDDKRKDGNLSIAVLEQYLNTNFKAIYGNDEDYESDDEDDEDDEQKMEIDDEQSEIDLTNNSKSA